MDSKRKTTRKGKHSVTYPKYVQAGPGKLRGHPWTTPPSLIFPEATRPDSTTGRSHPWTTPDYFFGALDDGSSWLKLEIAYKKRPDPGDVRDWLKQVLAFEIGYDLAEQGLKLMQEPFGKPNPEFKEFLERVAEYIENRRTPKKSKK